MDLSALGIAARPYRVIPIQDRNLVSDFIAGKFQVIGVECNARGVYGSPVQQSLKRRFPEMVKKLESMDYSGGDIIGRTIVSQVQTKHSLRLFVANMFITNGFGIGRNDRGKSSPINRFSARYLEQAFESLLEQCEQRNIAPDRQIAVQRMYGGLGGVSWEEVCQVLDSICEKYKFNMMAYLPQNYNSKYVRGTAK